MTDQEANLAEACIESAMRECTESGAPLPTTYKFMEMLRRISMDRGAILPIWIEERVCDNIGEIHRYIIRQREKGFVPSVLIDMRGSSIPHGVEVHAEEAPARFCRVLPGTPAYEASQFEIGTVKASLATTIPVGSKIIFSRCVPATMFDRKD